MIKFPMIFDKRTRYITAFCVVAVATVLIYFFISSGGSYLPAWLTILGTAIALLAMLSIPRYVIVTSQSVEIHCMLELVQIKLSDIERIKRIERQDMKACIPFLGIYGIFGYFGYFINLRTMRTCRLYARRWSNFIMVEDRYDNRFIFSVEDPEKLIEELEKKI